MRISAGVQTCALPIFEIGDPASAIAEILRRIFRSQITISAIARHPQIDRHRVERPFAGERELGSWLIVGDFAPKYVPERHQASAGVGARSEERRVGKGGVRTCRYRW